MLPKSNVRSSLEGSDDTAIARTQRLKQKAINKIKVSTTRATQKRNHTQLSEDQDEHDAGDIVRDTLVLDDTGNASTAHTRDDFSEPNDDMEIDLDVDLDAIVMSRITVRDEKGSANLLSSKPQ